MFSLDGCNKFIFNVRFDKFMYFVLGWLFNLFSDGVVYAWNDFYIEKFELFENQEIFSFYKYKFVLYYINTWNFIILNNT